MVASLLFTVACGEKIPIKEMVAARQAISKALSVKADKYANQELEAAKAKLIESHDFVKKDDVDKAALSAGESLKLAEDAYNKALPLLAKDTIDVADQSLNEAVEVNAQSLAKPEYDDAKAAVDAAHGEYENKQYYNAYKKALEADKKAKDARTAAIGKKEILKDSIDEVKITLQKADSYNAEKHAPENRRLAADNIALAEESYNNLTLKKGFDAVEVAKMNADEAYTRSIKETASGELASAESVIARAESSDGAKIAPDELAASKESYNNAKSMYNESRYKESIDFSRESARLAGIVAVTRKPGADSDSVGVKDGTGDDKDTDTGSDDDGDRVSGGEGEQDYVLYTVVYREKLRDCLWRIADRYYNDPWKWKHIYKANKDKIKDPDLIYPGWVLKVPKLK
jgi:nucleoid-associated protein YgaU